MSTKQRSILIPKVDKTVAKIIFNVRSYFEKEKDGKIQIGRQRVVERTSEATGISRYTISKIKNINDIDNFPVSRKFKREKKSKIDAIFKPIIRSIIRDMIVEEKKIPTLSLIHNKLLSGKYAEFSFLDYIPKFIWCKETMRLYMKKTGFAYQERKSH